MSRLIRRGFSIAFHSTLSNRYFGVNADKNGRFWRCARI
jgi:hypothetical protein